MNLPLHFQTLAILILATSVAGAQEPLIRIHADHVTGSISPLLTGACIEDVNHEIYGGIYSQMIFGESFQEPAPSPALKNPVEVSRMWKPVIRGGAVGHFSITGEKPFIGVQSQQVSFDSGQGEIGIENQGLNHWGMNFVAGKNYDGCVWVRASTATTLFAALESRDGGQSYGEQTISVRPGDWQRIELALTPKASDKAGRFALLLKQPGAVTIGHCFLEPGEWGRFKGLPVRRDVAEGLIKQGVTLLRYGGSMVNEPGYQWKKMIGPRDRRPPYHGTWYPYSTNGWGIADFMSFCESAGFEYVPAFNINESPADMGDFIDYAAAPAHSEWGQKRAQDGHPEPYHLHYMELGNEERVDEQYAGKFEALAIAIWAKDPRMILVVGDFAYDAEITDPFHLESAASGISTLAAHQRILGLAKAHDAKVWFDVHVGTEKPVPVNHSLRGMLSFSHALDRIADGARHQTVVFEFNAGNHAMKRAVANALAILALERDGRIPMACSANCLQPDKQNDNHWDQGLLFLNPSQVWLQPPGYLTQMLASHYQPNGVECSVSAGLSALDATAAVSKDGKTLVVQVVNPSEQPTPATIALAGFVPSQTTANITELSGPFDAVNTAEHPDTVVPRQANWKYEMKHGEIHYEFPPRSITVLEFH
jgi:hypothetical protein